MPCCKMSFYVKLFSEKANEVLEDLRQMIGLDLIQFLWDDETVVYWLIRELRSAVLHLATQHGSNM